MRILAIETVETQGSVAALARDELLAERLLAGPRRSAQTLAPAIAELLAEVGWRPADVQLVAVANGPGSFTGLRIGVTTAKAFAYAVGCELIGVHTLLAIASRVPDSRNLQQGGAASLPSRFWAVLDAHRGELFAAEFVFTDEGCAVAEGPTRVVNIERWLAALTPHSVVTGPGLEKLIPRLPAGVGLIDRAYWAPTAAAVGRIGWRNFAAGERISAFDLVPQYFRQAAAEESRAGVRPG